MEAVESGRGSRPALSGATELGVDGCPAKALQLARHAAFEDQPLRPAEEGKF